MAARKRTSHQATKHVPPRRSPTPRGVEREAAELGARGRPAGARTGAAFELDSATYVRGLIRDVPDFPRPGILFKDITPLVGDARGLQIVIDRLTEIFTGRGLDAVVAIESRGFIFGGALAARLGARFVPVRKAGKLPYLTDRVSYELEYGTAEVEVHRDALRPGSSVIVVDDLLATGGTAAAATALVQRQGAVVVAHAFVVELAFLAGRQRLEPVPVVSLLQYD